MTRAYPYLVAILVALAVTARPAVAQAPTGSACADPVRLRQTSPADPYADFARLAQLADAAPQRSLLLRRGADEREALACPGPLTAPWIRRTPTLRLPGGLEFELLPLTSSTHYNSMYPRDRNNGALWAGRGLSAELRGGVAFRWGPLSAAAAPVLIYQQNRDFEIVATEPRPGLSHFVYRGRVGHIDWPRRPGDESVRLADLGQSYLRLDLFPIAVGISNENLWWGPARRNPLMMSSTAPGFPHLFFGSSRPVNLWIGRLEGELIWGRLDESEYFDSKPENDRRLLASMVFSFAPRWPNGLNLGATRSFLRKLPPDGLPLRTWLLEPYRDIRDNPDGADPAAADNQLFSVFAHWAHPRSGFEIYFEFMRDDHWADLRDLIAEPEVSGAFTVGIQKVLTQGERWWRIAAEATQMADPLPTVARPLFTLYAHGHLPQGYTHRGRLLGAPIGPNSNAQYLGVDLFTPGGRRGVFIERVRTHVDANGERWVRTYGADGADIEWSVGVHQHLFLRHIDLGWSLTHSYRRNRDYIGLFADTPYYLGERNWSLRIDLGWHSGSLPLLTARRTAPSDQ